MKKFLSKFKSKEIIVPISKELCDIASQLDKYIDYETPELDKLENAANRVGESWSGSWAGYHSRVYYASFHPPPPGALFSQEWGLDDAVGMGSRGDWVEYRFNDVIEHIQATAGYPATDRYIAEAKKATKVFENVKSSVLSFVHANVYPERDEFLQSLVSKIESLKILTETHFIQRHCPRQMMSRDIIALEKGMVTPPHIQILAKTFAGKHAFQSCKVLKERIVELTNHIQNIEKKEAKPESGISSGEEVFIVHGRDDGTKETIARFVEKFGLKVTILHEQPNEGRTIIEKLEYYASKAGFAIVLLTPDDVGTLRDRTSGQGEPRARQNVVFELGYFMGKLGRERVCPLFKGKIEKPSDIDGVIYVSMNNEDWKLKLGQEMKNAGFPLDMNKIF